jgi:hypothetical protein
MAARVNPRFIAFALVALPLAACSSPTRYPSLAIRDVERPSGTATPAPPDPYVPPATPPQTLDRLGRLAAEAETAHHAFLAAADKARAPVAAAAETAEGSAQWAAAEIALANLEAARSQTMVPLAELDRLYVDAEHDAADLTRISAARDQVNALVESEDRTLAELRGT